MHISMFKKNKKSKKNKVEISLIVVTRDRYQRLIHCLSSLKTELKKNNIELIVVDDCSTDATKDISGLFLKKYCRTSRIFHLKEQKMMVKARNYGAKMARGELILFVDDDNILSKNIVDLLCKIAIDHKDYGVVGPRMCYRNKECYMLSQKFNFLTGMTSRVVPYNEKTHFSLLNNFLISKDKSWQRNEKVYQTDGIPNVFLIKKKVFQKCGFFDEELIQTYTELDFALHIRKFGYLSVIFPGAKAYHQVEAKNDFLPEGLGAKFKQKAYCLIRNRMIMVKRYGNILQKVIFLFIFSWLWPLVYSLFAFKNRRTDLIKIYLYGFKDGIIYFFTGKLINSLPRII